VWVGLGAALAMVALAVIGLTLHELKTERVVHSIELREQPARDREPIAAWQFPAQASLRRNCSMRSSALCRFACELA
jgi:hypothetical protein